MRQLLSGLQSSLAVKIYRADIASEVCRVQWVRTLTVTGLE
jgi:hypothetical protein